MTTTRPERLFPLFAPAETVDGVGKKTAASLQKIGITTVKDLLFHLPTGAIERHVVKGALAPFIGSQIIVKGRIGYHRKSSGGARSPYHIAFFYGEEEITLAFFHARAAYLEKIYPLGAEVMIAGKLERFRDEFQILHPDLLENEGDVPRIEPVYGLTEGVSQKLMRKAVKGAFAADHYFGEWLRKDVMEKERFPSFSDAVFALHHPQSPADIAPNAPARTRLAYDELLSHQLAMALMRAKRKTPRGKALSVDRDLIARAEEALPFALTGAQNRALSEIFGDFASEKRMFRMLQGDVGAGKTAVAFLAMIAQLGAGYQTALLAPTAILARQHFGSLSQAFENLGYSTVLLLGADPASVQKTRLKAIESGEARVIIGTHALFQDRVAFANLGLAIIDEQHRFGVRERMRLVEKGGQVDLLAMSATPIPRSLAMTLYGEMDLSILDEKPPGRSEIITSLLSIERLDALIERVKAAIADGRQVYWVCPLVSESEVLDLTAAEARFAALKQILGEAALGMVHGQMPQEARDREMQRFRDGEIKLLVATTVIEVGVDVPQATIMVIEGAERFGLAQLHQLRGRVGRGDAQSHCILLYGDHLSGAARARLELMRETQDGFRLAEADLKARGAGELIGTAQSGLPRYQIADLESHGDLVPMARDDARLIVETDSALESERGQNLRLLLYLFERDQSVKYLSSS